MVLKVYRRILLCDREPVKDWGDMVGRSGFSDDSCSRVMNQLGLMEGLSRETEEERAEVSCLLLMSQ